MVRRGDGFCDNGVTQAMDISQRDDDGIYDNGVMRLRDGLCDHVVAREM